MSKSPYPDCGIYFLLKDLEYSVGQQKVYKIFLVKDIQRFQLKYPFKNDFT